MRERQRMKEDERRRVREGVRGLEKERERGWDIHIYIERESGKKKNMAIDQCGVRAE